MYQYDSESSPALDHCRQGVPDLGKAGQSMCSGTPVAIAACARCACAGFRARRGAHPPACSLAALLRPKPAPHKNTAALQLYPRARTLHAHVRARAYAPYVTTHENSIMNQDPQISHRAVRIYTYVLNACAMMVMYQMHVARSSALHPSLALA